MIIYVARRLALAVVVVAGVIVLTFVIARVVPGDPAVPKTSSTSRDQAIFVDQATDASVSSDAVVLEIGRFG